MRKRFFLCLALLLVLAAPAAAQDDTSLAASMPVSAALYAEMDLTAESELQQIVRLIDQISGNTAHVEEDVAQASVSSLFAMIMPTVSFSEDIEPWLGDTAAIALFAPEGTLRNDHFLAIFPTSDPAALAEHRDALIEMHAETATVGDVTFYQLFMDYQMAVLDDALWIGSENEIRLAIDVRSGTGDALADNAIFTRLWAQFPPDATLKVGVSGSVLRSAVGEDSVLQLHQGLQIMLRVNPSESEAETALFNADWIDSAGAAIDISDNQIEITALALVDARYAAPTLSSESAGAALLDYLPGDSMLVFDSYDPGILAMGSTLLLAPAVGRVFDNIVRDLQDGTPAATPTPPPTPTVDEIIKQEVNPALSQVETVLGANIAEVFNLLSGEYAFAIFGGLEGPLMGSDTGGLTGALWIQTSDPERFLEVLDTGMQNVINMNSNSSSTVERREETYNNRQVIVWSDPSIGDALSYGILSDDVVFITMGESAPLVTQASLGDGVLPQSDTFPEQTVESMGTGNEALLYVDAGALSTLVGDPRFSSFGSIVATADAQADGVFVLRVVIPMEAE